VPEAGDEVQTMKAGLMEIADVFVVNKSDRPEADVFVKHLSQMLAPARKNKNDHIPVIKTVASQKIGIEEVGNFLMSFTADYQNKSRHADLLAEKAFQLIQQKRMNGVSKQELRNRIEQEGSKFNLYQFIQNF